MQVAAVSPIYRRGIAAVLQEYDVHVAAPVADGDELLAAGDADVVLAQAQLPGLPGAMRGLQARSDRARVILLLASDESLDVGAALRHSPAGLLLQDAGSEEFLAAVQAAAAGWGWVSAALVPEVLRLAVTGAFRQSIGDVTAGVLSRREREVLILVATGRSNRRVAAELFIAENTVKNHVRHILAKLGLSSRVEATLYAVSIGLVDSGEHT